MTERGIHTRQEIFSQPETWRACLDRIAHQAGTLVDFYREGRFEQILFTGCGSPFYAAQAVAPLAAQLAGLPTRALPGSEVFHYPEFSFDPAKRTLLVALSRSGETTELLRACQAFRQRQPGEIVTLSCYPDKPLTTEGSLNLVFPEAGEASLAQTRALSSLYLAAVALTCVWAGRSDLCEALQRLPDACARLLTAHGPRAEALGADRRFGRFYFLGSGVRYGLASEISLKMKETSLSHSEPFHVLEFRHGPKAMVNGETLILAMLSSGQDELEMAVAGEMRTMGAEVVVSGEAGVDVNFACGIPEAAAQVLHLPFGQLPAYARSMVVGLHPDLPENLNAVVFL